MAVIFRRRITVAVAAVKEEPPLINPQPRRMLRTTTLNTAAAREAVANAAKAKIDEQLKLISDAERAIDEAQAQLQKSYVEVEQLMKSSGLTMHTNGVHLAEIIERWTNQTRVIDPQKFRNAVSNDVFWKSISVPIGEAKQHLSDGEINRISTITPGTMTGHVLKVKKIEPKTRSRK